MTALTATERGELAERLLPVAAKLACIVHGDGDHHDVDHHTRAFDRTELLALVVVLAGLVNPDQSATDALSYVTWDAAGRPAAAVDAGRVTIRELTGKITGPMGLGADMVTTSERIRRAHHLFSHDDLTVTEVARAIGASPRLVEKWRDLGGWRQAPRIVEADSRPSRRGRAA
jgi:hypothetical protein